MQFSAAHSKLPSAKQFHQQQQSVDSWHFHLWTHLLLYFHPGAIPQWQVGPPLQLPYVVVRRNQLIQTQRLVINEHTFTITLLQTGNTNFYIDRQIIYTFRELMTRFFVNCK